MSFITDRQTFDDLKIFGKRNSNSIYNLFCNTHSSGGAALLEKILCYPLHDKDAINNRSDIIRFFQVNRIDFPFDGQSLDVIDKYLQYTDSRSKLSEGGNTLGRKFRILVGTEDEYKFLHTGVTLIMDTIRILKDFIHTVKGFPHHECYGESLDTFEMTIQRCGIIKGKHTMLGRKHLKYSETAKYDKKLRFDENATIRTVLESIFLLDVFISVAKIAEERKFVFAKAIDSDENKLTIKGLCHPHIENPVKNDISICGGKNMIFLTGANMAGKSTLMKSFGISVYLAHVGFPVPATSMEFCVQDGIFTTINLPDNINTGYSHFYAEVMRVKKIAYEVATDKRLIVIFDELFRGTNVKDAYDASVAILEAFSKRNRSIFIVSTHIIEVGKSLIENRGCIQFLCLPAKMEREIPTYTYKLQEGITNDRHGMVIIRNENIFDILAV